MHILIIGGDRIDSVALRLRALGVEKITHWNARKESSTSRKRLPKRTDCIIMITEYLGHNIMKIFKKEAKRQKIPFLCTKRCEHDILCRFCRLAGIQGENCPLLENQNEEKER